MTLAIVTTYYNEVETIDEVVAAIAKTSSPFAFYLVDDCSSKPPKTVIERYGKEDWFHYLRNDENKGPVFGLNRGIKAALANGAEFIAINDSDDISYENRFTEQLIALKSDPSLMIIGGAADFTDQETGQLLWNTQHPPAIMKRYTGKIKSIPPLSIQPLHTELKFLRKLDFTEKASMHSIMR